MFVINDITTQQLFEVSYSTLIIVMKNWKFLLVDRRIIISKFVNEDSPTKKATNLLRHKKKREVPLISLHVHQQDGHQQQQEERLRHLRDSYLIGQLVMKVESRREEVVRGKEGKWMIVKSSNV